jgi:hypothetical protein
LKPSEFLRVLRRPGKEVKLGVESLVPRIFASGVTLILGFLEVIRESLVGWTTDVEASALSMIAI